MDELSQAQVKVKSYIDEMRTRMKELRARFDLTQEDLAHRVGVRRETILFLEKGKYNPSLRLAHIIARVFGMSIEEFFIFDDNE